MKVKNKNLSSKNPQINKLNLQLRLGLEPNISFIELNLMLKKQIKK